jgi:hypothetical protein
MWDVWGGGGLWTREGKLRIDKNCGFPPGKKKDG